MSCDPKTIFSDSTYNTLTAAIIYVIDGAADSDPVDTLDTLEELFRLRSLARSRYGEFLEKK